MSYKRVRIRTINGEKAQVRPTRTVKVRVLDDAAPKVKLLFGHSDLVARAKKAYFKYEGDHAPHPSGCSEAVAFDGHEYVVLVNRHGTLGLYEILKSGKRCATVQAFQV